jgi:hypothetical protein
MASKQELQVQQKRELETKQETTIPARTFLPPADIFEAEDALAGGPRDASAPGFRSRAGGQGGRRGLSRKAGQADQDRHTGAVEGRHRSHHRRQLAGDQSKAKSGGLSGTGCRMRAAFARRRFGVTGTSDYRTGGWNNESRLDAIRDRTTAAARNVATDLRERVKDTATAVSQKAQTVRRSCLTVPARPVVSTSRRSMRSRLSTSMP